MKKEKNTVPDSLKQKVELIEDHCKQVRSETIAEGISALASALSSRDREINLAPLKNKGVVRTA